MYFFLSFISVFLYLCHPGYSFYMLKKKQTPNPCILNLRKINNQRNQGRDKLFIIGFLYAALLPPSITNEIQSEILLNLNIIMCRIGLPVDIRVINCVFITFFT